ncbi:hypothetical protein [Lysobacter capsici]|uniref:hypothetical protein n=1 Tax=Lysobacter capsici TaxID=435897 RepID=UPI00287BBBB2|nr:hypothetical protein [Lysobacter capsici]WND81783.1 hypothetical protein RJ610_05295 [Lysobacter capsici]WND86980.1 hypothetical protein RJ609_05300 [Lysobacter capsici]
MSRDRESALAGETGSHAQPHAARTYATTNVDADLNGNGNEKGRASLPGLCSNLVQLHPMYADTPAAQPSTSVTDSTAA